MANRKKKKKKSSGGSAFGSSHRKKTPVADGPLSLLEMAERMGASSGAGGRDIFMPKVGKDETILRSLPEGASEDDLREAAQEALALNRENYDAWQLLAACNQNFKEAEAAFLEGITVGREALADCLPKPGKVGSSWLHMEARPYLNLYRALADFYLLHDKHREAAETFLEILRLNKGDNQGVRGTLLFTLLRLRDYEQAEEVLSRFNNDCLLTTEVVRILLPMSRFVDGLDRELRENPEKTAGVEKHLWSLLRKECPGLEAQFRKLEKRNDFLAITVFNPVVLEMEESQLMRMGGIDEALEAGVDSALLMSDPTFSIVGNLWLTYSWKQLDEGLLKKHARDSPRIEEFFRLSEAAVEGLA